MEDLLTKIADILDMSIDGVIANYPILRSQYVVFYAVSEFLVFIDALFIIISAITFFLTLKGVIRWLDDEGFDNIKASLVSWAILVVIVLIRVVVNIILVKSAPDLMFLKTLL